jgi:rhodanese-related sulfurtransferase
MAITTISVRDLHAMHGRGERPELIDVRTPAEFGEIHVDFARNVPLDSLEPAAVAQGRQGPADSPLFFICRSGGRSKQACEKMLAAGYSNAVSVEGGTTAWAEACFPVVRGRKAVSLERQVRIAAGSLVVLGAALSYFHPAFVILSGLVGAGLIFAGVTDTCGMGMILARMPWNRTSGPASACQVTRSQTTK